MAMFPLIVVAVHISYLIIGIGHLKVAVNPIRGRSAKALRAVQQMFSKLSNVLFL